MVEKTKINPLREEGGLPPLPPSPPPRVRASSGFLRVAATITCNPLQGAAALAPMSVRRLRGATSFLATPGGRRLVPLCGKPTALSFPLGLSYCERLKLTFP